MEVLVFCDVVFSGLFAPVIFCLSSLFGCSDWIMFGLKILSQLVIITVANVPIRPITATITAVLNDVLESLIN